MKLDINDVYNEYLHMTYRQRKEEAIVSINRMNNFLVECGIEESKRVVFYLNLTKLFVAADGKASLQECTFFNDLFGASLSFADFSKMISGGDDKEFVLMMNKFIDMMDENAKIGACSYGLLFLSMDQNLTDKEKAVFEYILK